MNPINKESVLACSMKKMTQSTHFPHVLRLAALLLRMHSAQGAQGIFSNQNGNPTEMRSNNAILFV